MCSLGRGRLSFFSTASMLALVPLHFGGCLGISWIRLWWRVGHLEVLVCSLVC